MTCQHRDTETLMSADGPVAEWCSDCGADMFDVHRPTKNGTVRCPSCQHDTGRMPPEPPTATWRSEDERPQVADLLATIHRCGWCGSGVMVAPERPEPPEQPSPNRRPRSNSAPEYLFDDEEP